jgi:large conductance mechanosensitive channel
MDGFKKFLLRGNVVDLAIGVVIGASFTTVVDSLVKGVLTPLIGLIGGIPDLSSLTFKIGKSTFEFGLFLNSLLSFAIVAAVIYFFVVLPMNKLISKYAPAKDAEIKE